jgi:ABC-type Fe3+-hydroxamate transport system substrate-binding protein
MFLKPLSFFSFSLLLLTLAACSPRQEVSPQTTIVTDDLGRSVRVPDTIERVVTLAPNLTELVFVAGAGSRLVGVTTADDFPPAIDSLPKISALPLDFEALARLNPDLVLATDQVNSLDAAETFNALDIPVYFFSYNDIDGLLHSLRTTGDLLGTPAQAAAAADSLQAALDVLGQRTKDTDKPLTLFLIGDDTLYAFGDESYVHDLIALAGGHSTTEDIGTNAPILSDEFVLTTKPDVIFGAFGEEYDPARLLALHPTWDIVPAVVNGRVYSLDPSLILRPGPRLVEGARQMAIKLHPALFPPSDTSSSDTTATR